MGRQLKAMMFDEWKRLTDLTKTGRTEFVNRYDNATPVCSDFTSDMLTMMAEGGRSQCLVLSSRTAAAYLALWLPTESVTQRI